MKERSKPSLRKILYVFTLVFLIAVFVVSAGLLIKYFAESLQSKKTYSQIQSLRGDFTRPTASPSVSAPEEQTEPTLALTTVTDPQTGESVTLLPELAELYVLNPDLVGWLTVPGTNIDYPVVQRPESVDYYLHRDFYGNSDAHGCLYAREVCNVAQPSDNITIYGHRMKDRTMFADLSKYESKDFWQKNQYLHFDTLTEYHTYQIIYVFTTTSSVDKGFQYHLLVDAADQEEFNGFLVNCARNSLYDTGLSATYGDKLVTLSTCEYTQENGRLVVVAKRID